MSLSREGLSARDACVDAVLRFVESIDLADAALFDSAWADDAVMDLSQLKTLGLPGGQLEGKATIRTSMIGRTALLDTQHMVTNFRVSFDAPGDGTTATAAKLTAYAQAQHKRTGEGSDSTKQGALMGNRYEVDMIRADGHGERWVMRRFVLTNMWIQGDVSVLAKKR